MTPRAPSKERVEELRAAIELSWSSQTPIGMDERADLLGILDDYSALKAENERLQRQVGIEQRKVSDLDGLLAKYHEAANKAEAQLEKQRPLIEAAMGAEFEQDAEGRIYVFDSYQEAAILREALKLRSEK